MEICSIPESFWLTFAPFVATFSLYQLGIQRSCFEGIFNGFYGNYLLVFDTDEFTDI